ncbi:MAG: class I SAM-dependent methyltransferase [Candidatus Saccharimonadales bacterium]
MKTTNPVVKYYNSLESKLGYRYLAGVKHFGYYPEGQENLSKLEAQILMDEQMAKALKLNAGAHVLDAGCGEGNVAIYLAEKYGLRVSGVDLLDFNIKNAKANAEKRHVKGLDFQIASYMDLPFSDNSFDGVYTMETLVHAPDYRQALAELYRVLRPGGKLALFEYSITPEAGLSKIDKSALERIRQVNKVASMPAFNHFEHRSFKPKLEAAGFSHVKEEEITERMLPMLKSFYEKANGPYKIIKKFGLENHFINTMSAVEFYENPKLWRYNTVTASK